MARAQVTFTATGGVITSVTAIPAAGGSGYPANSTLDLTVTGGRGVDGVVAATTNANGVVINFALVSSGTGYSSTTGAATAANEITFAQPDNLVNQQAVVYHAGTTNGAPDTAIGGLTDGATYYVSVVNPTTIQLSLTAGGTPISLDPTQATGTGHFLSAEVVLRGVFSYGGTGTNVLNVDPNNTDWTLSSTGLTDPEGNQLQLNNVSVVTLTGGMAPMSLPSIVGPRVR